MEAGKLVYRVDDRSLFLPYYRRFLVDPLLPLIPRSVSPNSITHTGQLLNLSGTALLLATSAKIGWPLAAAALLLQAYVWCDNADGGHARRTGQCSAYGELLDHGLDILNTTYIAYLSAMALGAAPLWWVIVVMLIPFAAGTAYWEQSETGVFRLGLLNQIESCLVLAVTLMTSAFLGVDFWERVTLGPVTLRHAILYWVLSTIVFGIVRGMVRVGRLGLGKLTPLFASLAFGGLVVGAAAAGALGTVSAVVIATAMNLAYGSRMLALRACGKRPQVDLPVVGGAIVLGAIIAWRLTGHALPPLAGMVLAILACAVFGANAIANVRDALQALGRDEEPSVAAAK